MKLVFQVRYIDNNESFLTFYTCSSKKSKRTKHEHVFYIKTISIIGLANFNRGLIYQVVFLKRMNK